MEEAKERAAADGGPGRDLTSTSGTPKLCDSDSFSKPLCALVFSYVKCVCVGGGQASLPVSFCKDCQCLGESLAISGHYVVF